MDSLLESLLKLIDSQLSLSGGEKNILLQNLNEYLPEVYMYSVTIMDIVVKPVAYALLGFFLLIELQSIARKYTTAGNAATAGLDMLISMVIKIGLCSIVMRNLALFLKAIMQVGIHIIEGISNMNMKFDSAASIDTGAALDSMSSLGFFSKLFLAVALLIVLLIAFFSNIVVKIIIFMRFLELYVFLCISPLPVSTLPNQELGNIGKNFFKTFFAASLQGTLLFIVLTFYPLLVNGVFKFGANSNAFEISAAVVGQSIALILCLVYTNKWSKSITTAV